MIKTALANPLPLEFEGTQSSTHVDPKLLESNTASLF
jgi:hypothetical protein